MRKFSFIACQSVLVIYLFIYDNYVFICYSTTVEEQVAYGGKVVGESAMVNAEDIGNEVIHKYFVSTLCFVVSFMSENRPCT